MEQALITNIQGYSIHDGPGIRTVVFLKGCPLRCKWCANPENLEDKVLIGWIQKLCKGCGRCKKACPENAVLDEKDARIDRDKCTRCGKCVDACFYDALVTYGKIMTSKEVYEQAAKDKMFYDSSGGGVTVSGGEPLIHSSFVAELFSACKNGGIGTCVETCGCVPRERIQEALPVTDLFYFDLKIMNEELHKKYTGVSNQQIIENAKFLGESGAKLLFRQPLIPGVNDNEENVKATAALIRGMDRDDLAIQLMPYHRMGISKYETLALPYEMGEVPMLKEEQITKIEEMYHSCGIHCTVSR